MPRPLPQTSLPVIDIGLLRRADPWLRETVLAYLRAGAEVCATVLRGIALSMQLPADDFARRYTADPLLRFRIFNYPSRPAPAQAGWVWANTPTTAC